MVRRPRRLLSTAAFAATVAAACAAAPACVHAAELGDVRVTSHIGQPLTADIELTALDDPAVPVGVRIASPDIYSGAGLALPPVLSSVTLSVTRRDGRQFIHVTSLRPVDADHVHLYLDLVERGQHGVRLATVWLTPDPNPPAPVAPAVPVAAPVAGPVARPVAVAVPAAVATHARGAVAEPTPLPAATPTPTRHAHAELAEPAASVHPKAEPVQAAPPKAMPSPAVAAPASGVHAAAAPSDAAPSAASAGKVVAPAAAATVVAAATATGHAAATAAAKTVRPAIVPKLPSLHPAPATADASPAACARPADDALSCSALGNKNAELRAQLASLEDKVKRLQIKLGVTPAAALPAAVPGTAVLAKLPAPAHPQGGALAVQAVHAAKAALPAKAVAVPAPKDAAKEATKEAPKDATKNVPKDAIKEAAKDASRDASKDAVKPPPEKQVKPIIPPGPKPISSIKTLVPHKTAAPDDDDSLPLGWIGAAAAVLALAGATATLAARRGKNRRAGDPKPVGMLNRLKQRFGKRAPADEGAAAMPAPAAMPEHVEPSLE